MWQVLQVLQAVQTVQMVVLSFQVVVAGVFGEQGWKLVVCRSWS
jgi:hypothetical protein